MTNPPKDDQLPEAEAEERFKRMVGNLVNTPHKPHAEQPKKSVVRSRDHANKHGNN